ncbi:DUF2232 domain-containing protein [Arenibaculum pallidiluteum]|uniref:DUF2232 domain-containing protein n=1 Tax=Arenibaculum pallidiluteum TaxID=2812559 RepID=UPI001A95D516|nr:DUF2232 domain-containing protein [Arenibaculum pallidiluteum]
MSPFLLLAAGGGGVSALFFLSVLAGGTGALILAYLAPLPLLLLGLGPGFSAALLGGVTATAAVSLVANVFAGIAFALANLAPVLLVARQALLARSRQDGTLEWYPPGRLICLLAGYGALLIVGAAVLVSDQEGGLEGLVQDIVSGSLAGLATLSDAVDPAAVQTLEDMLVPFFPALVVGIWLAMTVANGALAQGLLMRFGRNRRPPIRMSELTLPGWAPMLLAGTGLLALLADGTPGYVALNAALVFLVPFLFGGLAVVHAFAERGSGRPLLVLVPFYFLLLVVQSAIPLVVGLGLIEHWAGLRAKLARPRPPSEDV